MECDCNLTQIIFRENKLRVVTGWGIEKVIAPAPYPRLVIECIRNNKYHTKQEQIKS
jgi:hypothetical protein